MSKIEYMLLSTKLSQFLFNNWKCVFIISTTNSIAECGTGITYGLYKDSVLTIPYSDTAKVKVATDGTVTVTTSTTFAQ